MSRAAVFAFCFLVMGTVHAAQEPESVFKRSCAMCHSGMPTIPAKGDKAAWEPRLTQGMDTLVKHVTEGYNGMPPRGLCMDCSAEDYKAVIEWMTK